MNRIEKVSNEFGSVELAIEFMSNKSLSFSDNNNISINDEMGFQESVEEQTVTTIIEDTSPQPIVIGTEKKRSGHKRDLLRPSQPSYSQGLNVHMTFLI